METSRSSQNSPAPPPEEMPPLVRELPRIGRYARHNEAENYRFRMHLKMHKMPNETLDTLVQTTTTDVWQQIDCLTCGNCCKTLQIVVDERDIRRLAALLNVGKREFLRRYVETAPDGVTHFRSSPCPFLEPDNRCRVYDDRPQACRDFPYLHDTPFRERTLSAIENTATCPIVFNVWQRLKWHFGWKPKNKSRKR